MSLRFRLATEADAPALAALDLAGASAPTARSRPGHWSRSSSERGVLRRMTSSEVVTGWLDDELVATLALATKKPWAIDVAYFTPVRRCLYLLNLAVLPGCQGQGLGRLALAEAERAGRAWP